MIANNASLAVCSVQVSKFSLDFRINYAELATKAVLDDVWKVRQRTKVAMSDFLGRR